jgi:class 3 adenylate cyclase
MKSRNSLPAATRIPNLTGFLQPYSSPTLPARRNGPPRWATGAGANCSSSITRWCAGISPSSGREIDTAGDGFLTSFDGPARGVRCAAAIIHGARSLGLDVRAGLHTGECEIMGEKLSGLAVHIGARVAAIASAGQVIVSSTVKDLVAGSGLRFSDRGNHVLKGVPGEWRVFALDSA